MESIQLDLKPHHIRKLRKGENITIKPGMVGSGMDVKMASHKIRKIHSAMKKGKGVRCCMTGEECEATGGKLSWKAFKRGLKKGWEGYKKYVKPIAGPLIRKGLKMAVEKGAQALTTIAPEAAPAIAALTPAVQSGVEKLGDVTGAYGIHKKRKTTTTKGKGMKKKTTTRSCSGRGINLTRGGALSMAGTPQNPLAPIGDLQHGAFMIKGEGVKSRKRYNTNNISPSLPATHPLATLSSPMYGNEFIRGVGYGVMLGAGTYLP